MPGSLQAREAAARPHKFKLIQVARSEHRRSSKTKSENDIGTVTESDRYDNPMRPTPHVARYPRRALSIDAESVASPVHTLPVRSPVRSAADAPVFPTQSKAAQIARVERIVASHVAPLHAAA